MELLSWEFHMLRPWSFIVALSFLSLVPADRVFARVFVTGTVVLKMGGIPIPGATVNLFKEDGKTLVSDGVTLFNGSFVIPAPAPGHYRLVVSESHCAPLDEILVVPPSGISGLRVAMAGHTLVAIDVSGPDGKPINQKSIQVWTYVSLPGRLRFSPAFVIDPTSPPFLNFLDAPWVDFTKAIAMDLVIRVPDAGFARVSLHGWPRTPVAVRLRTGAMLSGRVQDAAGTPAPSAHVTARQAGNGPLVEVDAIAGPHGEFRWPSMPPGSYSLEGDGGDGLRARATADLRGTAVEVTLRGAGR